MRRLRRGGFLARASRLVPVSDVLTWAGIPNSGIPPVGAPQKILCPFQETHPQERQTEKDMRIYADNKVFCHLCNTQYDSVGLAAAVWSLSRFEAAKAILARAGLDVTDDASNLESLIKKDTPEKLRSDAVFALGRWADAREVDRFSSSYRRCVSLAEQISAPHHVQKWLSACKEYLSKEMTENA